jgi:ribosomal protein S18 acetylase RimI-like enzyme
VHRTVRLTPGDAPAYRALMLQAYAQHPEAFTSSVAERAVLPLTWWEQRLSDASDAAEVVFGVRHGDQLVAAAGLSFDTREKARHKATLFGMYVELNARRHGLGAALVQRALAYTRSRAGVKLVQLTVTEGNHAAQALYTRQGFAAFGLEPMAVAVGDGFVAKIHMWCLL